MCWAHALGTSFETSCSDSGVVECEMLEGYAGVMWHTPILGPSHSLQALLAYITSSSAGFMWYTTQCSACSMSTWMRCIMQWLLRLKGGR
jgi:hypothetical protein